MDNMNTYEVYFECKLKVAFSGFGKNKEEAIKDASKELIILDELIEMPMFVDSTDWQVTDVSFYCEGFDDDLMQKAYNEQST